MAGIEPNPGPRETTYSKAWEDLTINDVANSTWLTADTTSQLHAKCKLCAKSFLIKNQGYAQIKQHAAGTKHMSSVNVPGQRTLVAAAETGTVTLSSSSSQRPVIAHEDKVAKAEVLWAVQICVANFSYRSSNPLSALFAEMFSDSSIAKDFKLHENKTSYLINYGIAPWIRDATLDDIVSSKLGFSISFDESTTSQVKKQMDIHVTWWSPVSNQVETAFVDAKFLTSATSVIIVESLLDVLSDLKLCVTDLISVGMDGPNVNKKAFALLRQSAVEMNSNLIDVNTCNLHIVHNAFSKMISKLELNVGDVLYAIHFFFKHSALRRGVYSDVEEITEIASEFVSGYSSSRWLSVDPACVRLLQQFDNLKQYFLTELPKSPDFKAVSATERYQLIKTFLRSDASRVYLAFIAYASRPSGDFLVTFQKREPMIHLLWDKLKELLVKYLRWCVKPDKLAGYEAQPWKVNLEDNGVALSYSRIEIGVQAANHLSKLADNDKKLLRLNLRSSLLALVAHLIKCLPLDNELLHDLRFLNPRNKLVIKSDTVARVALRLHQAVPRKIATADVDAVRDEWKTFQLLPEPDVAEDTGRIDKFWHQTLQQKDIAGNNMYPALSRVVRMSLLFPHGQGDVERGFSFNADILSIKRGSLSERSIVSHRLVMDYVSRTCGFSNVHLFKVPVTLLNACSRAHAKYVEDKAAKLKEKEIAQKQSTAAKAATSLATASSKRLDEIRRLKRKYETTLRAAEAVLSEGSVALDMACSAKKMCVESVTAANAKISMATKEMTSLKTKISKLDKEEARLVQRK